MRVRVYAFWCICVSACLYVYMSARVCVCACARAYVCVVVAPVGHRVFLRLFAHVFASACGMDFLWFCVRKRVLRVMLY